MAIKLDLALLQRQIAPEARGAVHDIRAQVIDVVQGVRHRRVPVTPSTFASGYVEISGAGLAAGQRVVDAQ